MRRDALLEPGSRAPERSACTLWSGRRSTFLLCLPCSRSKVRTHAAVPERRARAKAKELLSGDAERRRAGGQPGHRGAQSTARGPGRRDRRSLPGRVRWLRTRVRRWGEGALGASGPPPGGGTAADRRALQRASHPPPALPLLRRQDHGRAARRSRGLRVRTAAAGGGGDDDRTQPDLAPRHVRARAGAIRDRAVGRGGGRDLPAHGGRARRAARCGPRRPPRRRSSGSPRTATATVCRSCSARTSRGSPAPTAGGPTTTSTPTAARSAGSTCCATFAATPRDWPSRSGSARPAWRSPTGCLTPGAPLTGTATATASGAR